MSKIVTLDETVTVNRPLREVFAYVSEFSRIEEWDPGVAAGHRLTPGEPGVGSEFRIDMKAGFSLALHRDRIRAGSQDADDRRLARFHCP